jgi:hypothetical protein
MIHPKFTGIVRKGKLDIVNREDMIKYIQSLEGKEVELTIKQKTNVRTTNQNRYYYGVVLKLISDYTGDDIDGTHESMKSMFLRVHHDNGIPDSFKSTTDLTTKEMAEYCENIRRWASQSLHVHIPEPDEVEHE